MTTIIVVVVVALVFFVAGCVVTFMVWKRESEMRTDSIKAIEQNLEKLTYGLSSNSQDDDQKIFVNKEKKLGLNQEVDVLENTTSKPKKNKSNDPFGWVRETNCGIQNNEDAEEHREKAEQINIKNKPEIIEPENSFEKKTRFEIEPENAGEYKAHKDIKLPPDKVIRTTDKEIINNRTDESIINNIVENEKYDEADIIDEINLDFIDQENIGHNLDKASKVHISYDVGRSGKKYTASELETLIKE